LDIAEDIRRMKLQEERLQFSAFDSRTAWELGLALKAAAEARQAPIVVDIRLYSMRLLSFALPGGGPDNFDWVRRKRNVVFRFHRSSYAIGRKLAGEGKTLQDLGALPERDYAAHGGSFPILLKGTGCIGAVTVSGLPQRGSQDGGGGARAAARAGLAGCGAGLKAPQLGIQRAGASIA
jgi:uncharacterized protein (UPF0303 family)